MDIPDFQPREINSYTDCRFDTALKTLNKLKNDKSIKESYLIAWTKNQERVFSACNGSKDHDKAPELPTDKSLPTRAKGDYLYQLGSWHFYRHEYAEAMRAYQLVEKSRKTPMRPNAAYMVIRCLANLDRGEEAYERTFMVEADPSLMDVHAIAANYRFVMMNITRSSATPTITWNLASRHLKWLLSVVKADPSQASDPKQAQSDYSDAMEQLDSYFPLYDVNAHRVDWWLDDEKESSRRMAAVKEQAQSNSFVDWMQSKWAYNVLETDWLWALHAEDDAYWIQNRRIVEHELAQWNKSGNGAWLELAICRVHPKDPLASVLTLKADRYINRAWKSETQEYREWILALWKHSLRIYLGQGKFDQALALVTNHPDLIVLSDSENYHYRLRHRFETSYATAIESALKWLIYTGQPERARTLLNEVQWKSPNSYTQWRTLLAVSVDEIMASGTRKSAYSIDSPGTSKLIWAQLLNTASSGYLEQIADDDRIPQSTRAAVSRTTLTRAILLKKDAAVIDRLAALAAKQNPDIREEILLASSGHDRLRYAELLLRNPRFRPAVLLEYAANPEINKPELKANAIDIYNHNDNNWWCRFDANRFNESLFEAAKIVPEKSLLALRVSDERNEFDPYLENQRALIAAHPFHQIEDPDEISALQKVPSGPEYLSTFINQWESSARPASSEEERNRRAANLHRAVRTTRYGCNRDGSHAAYSKASFKLIHDRYEDTAWARATPYWFR